MTKRDRQEFIGYLRNCTLSQVYGVYEKERAANRRGYAELAKQELARRDDIERYRLFERYGDERLR